ncbi:MAG: 4-(cytidine 5'-diphospho)-2-C-methyl-D-erythritol kinase [Chitinophagaceae bacterium]|nr:MAG: 4-(cytidine 5'-diphospho)-2-C-methyl-D-erythritol kinase [Chitinophagaceae bacterium]
MLTFPNCKINLGLQVRRKRADGYHDLETVFYPVAGLQDALEVIRQEGVGALQFSSSGNTVTRIPEQNICVKAYGLLQERFPDLPSVKMHLHKVIPSGAGLGGGSADGAFALLALNQKLQLGLSHDVLAKLALELGSDCPFFIYNRPAFARGRGELIEPLELDLTGYSLLLVNPGIHVPTAEAFRHVRPDDDRPSLKELTSLPPDQWQDAVYNDFEDSVFRGFPAIAQLKEQMRELGAVYCSMSGSGSSVYGIFENAKVPPAIPVFPERYFARLLPL